MTATVAAPTPAPAAAAQKPPRVDLYAAIHKALRAFMGDTLGRVGAVDLDDADECGATFAQVEALLDLCRHHLSLENDIVHPAIEARRAGETLRIAGEHDEHLDAIGGLEAELASLRALPTAAAAHRFYRHLARFVGDNLEHMNVEETAHNQALWAAYSDTELLTIHQRLVAANTPDEMALVLRWMVPAMNPAERAGLLGALQQQMPPEAMRGVLEIVRPHLNDRAWGKLARALHIPIVPGLVHA
jgi:hemerythrin-like domain-containing protein